MAGAVPDERGVSLIELLVAMAMAGLVMAATVTLLLAGQAAHTVGTARAEATQSARVALERMGSELRQAGYDPQGTRFEPILVAEPARVTLQRDLNENGVIDPTRERITYLLRGTVLRREAGGGAQPLAEGVSGLWLTYYDRADTPTTDPSQVASVGIRIEVSRGIAFPLAPTVMETLVRFRNEKSPTLPPY
jgi:type IV pilus assembly protein PilW